MIRLTVNNYSSPEIHLFNKSLIQIGSDPLQVDIVLNSPAIKNIHIKIFEKNQQFFVQNITQDPFLSLDGLPFGKKEIKHGNVIEVDSFEIKFELLDEEKKSDTFCKDDFQRADHRLEKKLEQEVDVYLKLPELFSEEKIDPLEKEFQEEEIAAIFQDSTSSEKNKENFNFFSETSSSDFYKKGSAHQTKKPHAIKGKEKLLGSLQFWFWLPLIFLTLGIVIWTAYFSLSRSYQKQDQKAAQGVADVAMALTHAKLLEIKPHNQNWLDHDFLRERLQSLIPNKESHALSLDSQGRFASCSYTLRIYTNSDLSRFLLIAQPTSGFSFPFLYKSIIALDSLSMELRSFQDIRAINRLLASFAPLEGANGQEIGNLIQSGRLIRLAQLKSSEPTDFLPPQNIAWIKPGAENYIYNAPRYYKLTADLLKQMVQLGQLKSRGEDVILLKQKLNNFGVLNGLILYSENSKDAMIAYQSLLLFLPANKFLFGYLDIVQGKLTRASLLKEEQMQSSERFFHEIVAVQNAYLSTGQETEENQSVSRDLSLRSKADVDHPIFIQLSALVTEREQELGPLSAAILSLVNRELETPQSDFQREFQNLSYAYLIASAKHKQAIQEKTMALYHQYDEIPISTFIGFIEALNLDHLIIQKPGKVNLTDDKSIENLEKILENLKKCETLLELDQFAHFGLAWLNFDFLKDPQVLIKYQNALRNAVLDELKGFLLTGSKKVVLSPESRMTLMHILDYERLMNSEEKEFFLGEFDSLLEQHMLSL